MPCPVRPLLCEPGQARKGAALSIDNGAFRVAGRSLPRRKTVADSLSQPETRPPL